MSGVWCVLMRELAWCDFSVWCVLWCSVTCGVKLCVVSCAWYGASGVSCGMCGVELNEIVSSQMEM